MKFFKHFTDAHEGRSMQALMNEFGLEGYAAFFILTEICAKKMEKEGDETFSEKHTNFVFNERIIREKLRMRSTKVELFLNSCATLDLLQFTKVKDEYNFSFPKLLECLDRDANRAREDRAPAAPKIKNKIKNKSVWKNEAELCFKAVRKFGSNYEAMQWLGDSRKAYIDDIGGLQFIRGLKDNDFEVRRLADLIKDSWETLNSNQESA